MKKDLYEVPAHKYGLGAFINNVQGSVNKDTNSYQGGLFNGMNANLGNAMGAIGSTVGGIAGGLIAGGRESTAGSIINGLGDAASAIPGPWGAIAGFGLKAIGGLTNAAFGVKLNQDNINAVNNNIGAMNNFQSNASDFDNLAQNFNTQPSAMSFDRSYIGKNGWFNKGATKKFNQLQTQQDIAQQFVDNSLTNNMNNLVNTQSQNMLANYAAIGGPLSTHGSDWATGLNYIGAGGSHEQNPNGGIQQGIAPDGLPNLVEEGEVVWNGDYVFSKRLKVPKAVRNKYKLRGTKPLSFADAALEFNKEMEERPNDPISKRGRDAMLTKLADVQEEKRAKIAAKEQAQQAAMMGMMGIPQDQMAMEEPMMPEEQPINEMSQDMPLESMYAAKGGPIGHKYPYGTKLQYISDAPRDRDWLYSVPTLQWSEQVNPDYRRKAITDYILDMAQNSPDEYSKLIEQIGGKALNYKDNPQGLVDFAYTNKSGRERTPKTDPVYYGIWGSYNSKSPNAESLKTPTLEMPGLATPPINGKLEVNFPESKWDRLKKQFAGYNNDTDYTDNKSDYPWQGYLRYMPAVGSALGVFSDLMGWTNKPDYSAADAILNATKGVRDVSFRPIGDYAKYTPVDRMMALNQLNAASGAARRGILNTTAGNRGTAMAGMLAADNNYMNNIGNTLFTAENANYDRYMKALAHNADINKFNSEGFLKAAMANQGAGEVRAKYQAMAADARMKALQYASANRSANLTNLFDNLGNIGIDALNRADARWLARNWPGAGVPSYGARGGRINKRRRRRII